jgi:hypothetical protein
MTSLHGTPPPTSAFNGAGGPAGPAGTVGVETPSRPAAHQPEKSAGNQPAIPDIDGLYQLQCAALLQRMHGWLESVVPYVPQLASMVTTMLLAIDLYVRRMYQDCLGQILGLVGNVQELRILYPALPPL